MRCLLPVSRHVELDEMIVTLAELHSHAAAYRLELRPPFTLYQAYGGVLAVPSTLEKSSATLRIEESTFSGNSVVLHSSGNSSRKVRRELIVPSKSLPIRYAPKRLIFAFIMPCSAQCL